MKSVNFATEHASVKAGREVTLDMLKAAVEKAGYAVGNTAGAALGEASVQVKFGDDVVAAKGSDIDIVMASAKAYVNALNRHLFLEKEARRA